MTPRPEDLSAFASAHPDYNYASILKAFARVAQLSKLYAYGDFSNAHKIAGVVQSGCVSTCRLYHVVIESVVVSHIVKYVHNTVF